MGHGTRRCGEVCHRAQLGWKKSLYPLRNHITRHQEAQNEFVQEKQNSPYAVPAEHNHVRLLLQSITSNNGTVLESKTKIIADNANCNDFEQAVDLLILT